MNRLVALIVSFLVLTSLLGEAQSDDALAIQSREEVIARSLQVPRFFREKYDHEEGPLVIKPVAVPFGDQLIGNNNHFGWPVATMTGDTIIVVYLRQPQHTPRWGITKPRDEHVTRVMMTRSSDRGETWSDPIDLRTFVETPTNNCRLLFGSSMLTRDDGEVILVSPHGVFSTRDQGASWTHYPHAYSEDDLPEPSANNGPRLIEHPEHGIVSFGHTAERDLLIRYSKDGGRNWDQIIHTMSEPWAKPVEPTIIMHEGAMVMVARCHGEESFEPERKTWRYLQGYSQEGWVPMKGGLTTIRATDIRDEIDVSGYGPWSQDTVALAFNPVTQRFEAVCTNRNGGGQGLEQQRMRMTLNLWSIAPEELAAGSSEWRFDGTLLTRGGTMMTGADGMHPAGAVLDEEAGVQHIFVYLGHHLGPASIFRITRTLDTPLLTEFLKQYPE
ncbi:MAG: sialidase family protein [Phycisphaeraceae bacterium]